MPAPALSRQSAPQDPQGDGDGYCEDQDETLAHKRNFYAGTSSSRAREGGSRIR